jgi:hypothetical protein
VAEVDGVAGVLNQGSISPGGDIWITNHSPLTIDQIVGNTAGGDVVLTAFNDGGQDDHLRVNARVFASGGDGNIYLNAGGNLIINDSGLLSQNPLVPPSASTLGQADISVAGGGIVQGSVGGQIVIGGGVLIESQTGAIADVPPRLSRVVLDSDYDARLESSSATIRGQYGRVGERNFVLTVSWGDGTVENFARESAGEFEFTHDYLGGSFNQIPVTVTLVDDFNIQLGSGSVSVTEIIAPTLFIQLDDEDEEDEQDQSMFLSTIELDLSGIGRRQFDLVDQESTQPLMEQSTNVVNAVDADEAFISERSVFLVVLSPDGAEQTRVPISESDLNDLPALFYKLPDGRYQVLIRDAGEQRERLLRDVDVRNHIATDVRQEYRSDELQEQSKSNPIDQPGVTQAGTLPLLERAELNEVANVEMDSRAMWSTVGEYPPDTELSESVGFVGAVSRFSVSPEQSDGDSELTPFGLETAIDAESTPVLVAGAVAISGIALSAQSFRKRRRRTTAVSFTRDMSFSPAARMGRRLRKSRIVKD